MVNDRSIGHLHTYLQPSGPGCRWTRRLSRRSGTGPARNEYWNQFGRPPFSCIADQNGSDDWWLSILLLLCCLLLFRLLLFSKLKCEKEKEKVEHVWGVALIWMNNDDIEDDNTAPCDTKGDQRANTWRTTQVTKDWKEQGRLRMWVRSNTLE